MKNFSNFSIFLAGVFLATSLSAITPPHASSQSTVTTCTDLVTLKTIVLEAHQNSCKPLLAPAIWHREQSDGATRTGSSFTTFRTCTSKNIRFNYQLVKSKCAKYQNTNDFWRKVGPVEIPIIATTSARRYNSAVLALSATNQNADAPIAYYLITTIQTGQVSKASLNNLGELTVSNLSPDTSYTFSIAAVSVDGKSADSLPTSPVRTGALPIAIVAPTTAPIAAPAFTLSSSSETKTVNNAIAGYAITSSGGAIASYAISPAAPAGTTFDIASGLLSGIPTSVASATTYTITATNASGSATRIFTLTVTTLVYAIGSTGPGGGKIFYYDSNGFNCGSTYSSSGSPSGGKCYHLEAAPIGWGGTEKDLASTWASSTNSNQTTNVDGADLNDIGTGFKNSLDISAQVGNVQANAAARKARTYTPTVGGVTYSDWYLPSKNELNALYLEKTAVGGFDGDYYWSSTEYSWTEAWGQSFTNGVQDEISKSSPSKLFRPIRAF
jgi:hypothetical protein